MPDASFSDARTDDSPADRKAGQPTHAASGTHLLIDLIDGTGLDDAERVERALRDCVEACGARLLQIHIHRFAPQGLTGVAVLAESHITVHTWPEIGYGAFDVFLCGAADPMQAVPVLERAFGGTARLRAIPRGPDQRAGGIE